MQQRDYYKLEYLIERWCWLVLGTIETLIDKNKKVKNFWEEYIKMHRQK